MNQTAKTRQANWDLQMLTSRDPAAMTNVMRNVTAVAIMLAGRRQTAKLAGEPEIGGCFGLLEADRSFLKRVTAQTGIDQIFVTFDVDDAAGPHLGIALVRHEGDSVAFYDECRLWSPANGGRAVLVPTGTQDFGYFVHRRGGAMRHVDGRPSRDLAGGFRRAETRMAAVASSPALRSILREGYAHVLGSTGGTITDAVTKLAA